MRRRAHLKLQISWDKKLIKDLLKISIPFALTGILARFNTQVDTIFLSKVGCATQTICDTNVGIYSVATKITLALHFIPLAFVAALFPAFSEYYATNKEKLARTFEKSMRYLMIVSMPIALGILALAPDFVPKVFGAEYTAAVLPLQILMISLVFLFLTFPIGSLLNATSKQIENTKQIAVAALVNFLLNFYLVPKLTYTGGALSSLISTLVLFYLGLRISKQVLEYDKKYLFKSFLQCLVAGIVMTLVLWLLLFKINFIILIILGALIYFIFLLLLGTFKKSDLDDMLLSMKLKK
jgi:O-antigen/teichoic acid export membrane protein